MTYPYNGQLSPTVGGGLGGLPARKSVVTTAIDKTTGAYGAYCFETNGNNNTNGSIMPICQMTSDTFVSCRYDGTNNLYIVASKLNSDLTTTFGSEVQVVNPAWQCSVCRLNDTTGLLIYATSANIIARTFSLSGTTITLNSINSGYPFSYTLLYPSTIIPISETIALTIFKLSSTQIALQMMSISGTTVTFGSVSTINVDIFTYYQAAMLDSETMIITYRVSNYTYSSVYSISGTTLTGGIPVIVTSPSKTSDQTNGAGIFVISPTSVIVASSDSTVSNKPILCWLSISGTTISVLQNTAITQSIYIRDIRYSGINEKGNLLLIILSGTGLASVEIAVSGYIVTSATLSKFMLASYCARPIKTIDGKTLALADAFTPTYAFHVGMIGRIAK